MNKKDKEKNVGDFEKIKDEIIFDKVNEIFETQPDNYFSALEEMGFEYHDDDNFDEMEEAIAAPENKNQLKLVDYFEGKESPSEEILICYFDERDSDHPNLPLMRKYFRAANQNLKALILYGLDHYPARLNLLSDLAFFHEFENILGTLIFYYMRACKNEMNLAMFTELAQDFYYAATEDGYDALIALKEVFEPYTEKRKIIDFLINEEGTVNINTH